MKWFIIEYYLISGSFEDRKNAITEKYPIGKFPTKSIIYRIAYRFLVTRAIIPVKSCSNDYVNKSCNYENKQ
jgi:hypothetical protein